MSRVVRFWIQLPQFRFEFEATSPRGTVTTFAG